MSGLSLREIRENLEKSMLSPHATFSCNATKPRHEEPCPVRTEFLRDRDRILYSKAFRRLMHKTQVFIAPEGDHYRTRLTHTLEVSQIARTIARALKLNEDLTEAISLGHDLGHAPFGHAGERALDDKMREFGWDGFHHARQSLRVVDYLEKEGGLNLTNQVRNGIISHTKGSGDINNPDVFESPRTPEAAIVRISDRMAYINHDIDDAIRAGVISPGDVPADLQKLFGDNLSDRIKTMVIDVVDNSADSPHIRMGQEMEQGLNRLKNFMFERVYKSRLAKSEEPKAQDLIRHLFDHFMKYPRYVPGFILEEDGNIAIGKNRTIGMMEATDPSGMDSEDRKHRARTVCDFIAGMTDRFAIAIYKEIFLPRGWILKMEERYGGF